MDPTNQQQAGGGSLAPGVVGNGQLPDESYIEKLFPKCAPKQLQQTRANNFRQNSSSFRQNDNGTRQQHRRQNKLRPQPDRREALVDTGTVPTAARHQAMQLPGGPKDKQRQKELAKTKVRDWYNSSSDSSDDKETVQGNAIGSQVPGAMRRSGSNQYGFDASNNNINNNNCANSNRTTSELPNDNAHEGGPPRTAGQGRQKIRKYTASKNLQKQLQRSQSGHKVVQRPPPVDSSTVQGSQAEAAGVTGSSAAATVGSQQQNEAASLESSSDRNPSLAAVSSAAATATSSKPRGKDNISKTVSRTCRGIVFSEPPSSCNPDSELSDWRQPAAGQIASSGQVDSVGAQSPAAAAACLAPKTQAAPVPTAQLAARRQATQKATCETAIVDFGEQRHQSGKTDADKQRVHGTNVISDVPEPPPPTTTTTTTATSPITEPETGHPNHLGAATNEATSSSGEANGFFSTNKPVTSSEDQSKDDDKYINLFVYDNTTTPPRGLTADSEPHKEHVRPPSPPPKHFLLKSDSNTPPSLVHETGTRRGLLVEDLSENEQDVIRNDTSIEELCGVEDETEAETRRSSNSRRDQDPDLTELEPASIGLGAVKAGPKHHRSIGTLQTVDEKAEINVDEDGEALEGTPDGGPETSKTELIDISETNNMFGDDSFRLAKKGVAPPGFPRRVRPASNGSPAVNKVEEMPTSQSQTNSAAPDTSGLVSLSPTIVSRPSANQPIDSLAAHETRAQPAESYEAPTVRTTFRPSDESANAQPPRELVNNDYKSNCTEANLTEALNRVSLNQSDATGPPIQASNPRQHHKLPNETSHFSISRSISRDQPGPDEVLEVPRSKMQFNTLSDAESEPDEQPNIELHPSVSNRADKPKLSDVEARHAPAQTIRPGNSSQANGVPDDDLTPTTKTALVFPRLDEGLSSEAESCDDEAEEEDERAMEADVDADDDEDDEDDDDDDDDADDDVENSVLTNERVSMQSNIDPFARLNQGQSSKPQNNIIGALQQNQGVNSASMSMPGSDPHQMKSSSSSPYANFIPQQAHDALDQNDLKPIPNYSNQNGQNAYWPGAPSQPTLSTQPSSLQSQFNSVRNQHGNSNNSNNLNMTRPNNYENREEARSVNRLSSDTDTETDRLLGSQRTDQLQKMNHNELVSNSSSSDRQTANSFASRQSNSREVLIEGVLFSVKYLGSTHTECEGRGEKEDRIHQAELAVHEVKFRNGDAQPPAEVQLFISTEKIMVLDDKHRKIMMDHSLRTISYIADIGDAIVLIVRKKSTGMDVANEIGRPLSKTSCHVFESTESHTITKSISQAFQVAYTELLKANGASDSSSYLPKELDYQEVLNSQEMSMTELEMFARKDNQREVIVPKKKGEILGLSIVESGWGSVLPTAVIAGLKQDGPAYRCKKLSVGDQILSINGISLVGLSLADCQKILRKTKDQSVARLSVVPCPITVEVKIKRPDTKYQLGFSVQHGVICSLLRGGIAERGGVRVGHRIISINGTTVVGVPHDKIVTLLASSVGEIRMKTCLTSLYRHMLGEEKNVSFV